MKIKAVIVDDFIYEETPDYMCTNKTCKTCHNDIPNAYFVLDGVKMQVPYGTRFAVIDTDEVKREGIEEADKMYKRIMNMTWDDRRKAFGSADLFTVIPNNTYDELSEKLAAYDRKRKAEAKELIHRLKDLGYKVTVEETE